MRTKLLIGLFSILGVTIAFAQSPSSTPQERMDAFEKRQSMIRSSRLNGIECRSVGPTIMSGRVVDIEVDPEDATHFYVAYASGGLWETTNNGQSFEPLFDDQMVLTIGDIAIDWTNDKIWLGSGEVNSSRSSYSGMGVFMSEDNGDTWQHKGLGDSHHIGKVLVHPQDQNIIWVASLGHLYSDLGEAGVFRTSDGGETWTKSLSAQRAGAVDLILNPENPDVLYASLWERSRRAWNFKGSGPNSGIFKSHDGGQSFFDIAVKGSGFPTDEGVGRIGLALSVKDGKEYLYAFHDNQAHRPKEEDEHTEDHLVKTDFKQMSKSAFMNLPKEDVMKFLEDSSFPKEIDYESVKTKIENDEIQATALYDYLTDANSDLFDTPVVGAEVWKYTAGNNSWKKTHEGYLDNVVYSYGYYFGMIVADPSDPMRLYIAGVPIISSDDGGSNWQGINGDNVHVDHHVLWVNPDRPGHLINGNDGGINISYDNGEHWVKCNSPAVGQFYTVAVDNAQPYNIYGGLQDNGVWKGPSTHEENTSWHQEGEYPWELVIWGDGMQVQIDERDGTFYTGYQFGHYFRIEDGKRSYFHPRHELGERPLRWNWQTPIHLSIHNQDILYMGSNRLHRSMDQGESFEPISEDLTHGGKKGNVPYGTLTSIDESPFQFGKLLVGSDDGRVHLSPDGGVSWNDISTGLPNDLWVSRVWFSRHDEDRLYLSLNGYRWDDHKAYVYVSHDNGASWKDIAIGLPDECVNVVKEDRADERILYVGTDHACYVSLNSGESYDILTNGLPSSPVHDLVVQEREEDLVIGTHGRSIYVADIAPLRQMNSSDEMLFVTAADSVKVRGNWGTPSWFAESGVNGQEMSISGFKNLKGPASIEIKSPGGLTLWREAIDATEMGLFKREFDLGLGEGMVSSLEKEIRKRNKDREFTISKTDGGRYRLPDGEYTIVLSAGSQSAEHTVVLH